MKLGRIAALSLLAFCAAGVLYAQEAPVAPPVPARGAQAAQRAQTQAYTPTAEEVQSLRAKLDELNAAIKSLKDAKADDDLAG